MEPKSRSSNSRKNFITNNSPPGSPKKKRKFGKEETGWFGKMLKSSFIYLGIALIAVILSQYWPNDLLKYLSPYQKHDNEKDLGGLKPKAESRTAHINLPSGYTPSCPIRGKDSKSAINRAISDTCKIDIAELACRSVDAIGELEDVGDLYPTLLPNFCPTVRTFNPDLAGEYLGK